MSETVAAEGRERKLSEVRGQHAKRILLTKTGLVTGALLIVSLACIIGIWTAIVDLLHVPSVVLPLPSSVVSAFVLAWSEGLYAANTLVTLQETIIGFAITAVIGIGAAAVLSEFGLIRRVAYPYIVFFQAMPKIAVAPLLVVWLGFGLTSKVVTAVFVAFFAVLVNSIAGFEASRTDELALMTVLRASRWQTFRKVKLFNAIPYIVTGLDMAILYALLGAVVGEFVGAEAGLGTLLIEQQGSLEVGGMFATLIILSLMGLVLHLGMRALHRKVLRRYTYR